MDDEMNDRISAWIFDHITAPLLRLVLPPLTKFLIAFQAEWGDND
jgi:hypothetical protein